MDFFLAGLRKLAGINPFGPTMLPPGAGGAAASGAATIPPPSGVRSAGANMAHTVGNMATRLPPPPGMPGADVMKAIPKLRPLSFMPRAMKVAFFDEAVKLGAVSADQARRSLDRLDSLEQSKPTAEQVARYGVLGAGVGAVSKGLTHTIEGKAFGGRHALAGAAAGALGGGALPLARAALDRRAERGTLRKFMGQLHEGDFAKNQPALGDAA